jgi:hypothetical protein
MPGWHLVSLVIAVFWGRGYLRFHTLLQASRDTFQASVRLPWQYLPLTRR